LEHDLLCWGGTDDRAEPPEVGWTPGGPARITDIVPQEKGFALELRSLESADGIFTRPAQVPHRFIRHLGNVDRGRSPERIRRASLIAARRLVLPRSPGFLGIKEGATPSRHGLCWSDSGRVSTRRGPLQPSSWARAIAPRSNLGRSRRPKPRELSVAYRPASYDRSGPVGHGIRPAMAALQRPRGTALPIVCAHCRPIAPRDTGSLCVVRPAPRQPSDAPNRRAFRRGAGCLHSIAQPSRPQRRTVARQSFGMPPGVDRQGAMD
jgi:hypothetical protein